MSDSRVKLGDILCESRIPGSDGATARKITVKLYGRGVVPKNGTRQGSAATKYYRRHAGQLIYSKLDFLNGAIGVVPPELANHESTLDLPCFDIISADADPQWLLYYLSRPIFYLSFRGGAIGGRKAKRVQPAELIARRITLPPLSEQRRIAAILNAVDATIARTKGLICELRRTKRQVMGELFARAQIQEAVPIGKVTRIGNGTTPRKSVPTYWNGGTVPWLSSGKVNDYRVRRAEDFVTEKALSETSVKLWLKGTVLVGLIGQGRTRGMVARMEIEACINQNVAGIVCGECCLALAERLVAAMLTEATFSPS